MKTFCNLLLAVSVCVGMGVHGSTFASVPPSTTPASEPCSKTQSTKEGKALPTALLVDEQCVVYKNEKCEITNTCDLEEIGSWVKHFERAEKKSRGPEPEQGSMVYLWYKTQSLDTLEKYVFVQYVRGCTYDVLYGDGDPKGYFPEAPHGGKANAPFCFPDWEIDTTGRDPVYTSEPDESPLRHYYAQWTQVAREFPTKTAKNYGEEKPTYPVLGMVDSPTRAYVRKWGNGKIFAHNTALQFRSCLYKTADVPTDLDVKKSITAEPLKCVEWQSIHIYDPKADKIVSPQGLPDICKEIKDALVPFLIRP